MTWVLRIVGSSSIDGDVGPSYPGVLGGAEGAAVEVRNAAAY